VPADVRGESFVLKTEDGRKLDLEIRGKEAVESEKTSRAPKAGESAPAEPAPKPAAKHRSRGAGSPVRGRKRAK